MPYEFKITRRVEFAETDMAGIMHFSNFFRFMETAEHAFYRSLGFSVDAAESLGVGWPRVHASCDYKRPLRFEDEVEVHLLVREVRSKSIHFEFVFRKTEKSATHEVARGSLGVCCVKRNDQTGQMKATDLPQSVRAKIQAAPRELLEKKD